MRDHVPAFPTAEPGDPDKWGMDLRDYLAGQAMSGLVAHGGVQLSVEEIESCYEIADAMMEARKK